MDQFIKYVWIIGFTLFLFSGCVSVLAEFPVNRIYIVDLVNGVCAEYEIVDQKNLKFELRAETGLNSGGPCDRLVGFNRDDFDTAKNWIRDAIKAGETCK